MNQDHNQYPMRHTHNSRHFIRMFGTSISWLFITVDRNMFIILEQQKFHIDFSSDFDFTAMLKII
jgi:hypothetical protein